MILCMKATKKRRHPRVGECVLLALHRFRLSVQILTFVFCPCRSHLVPD